MSPHRIPRVSHVAFCEASQLWRLSLGTLAIASLVVPWRGIGGQGLRTATSTVSIVAVKHPEGSEGQAIPSSRAWDGAVRLPPWARQLEAAEVRMSSAHDARQRWYVRMADGKLTLLTGRWTFVASHAPVLVRVVSPEPPADVDGPLLSIRGRARSGNVLTAELPIVWERSR